MGCPENNNSSHCFCDYGGDSQNATLHSDGTVTSDCCLCSKTYRRPELEKAIDKIY